jgi:hypothetical protein
MWTPLKPLFTRPKNPLFFPFFLPIVAAMTKDPIIPSIPTGPGRSDMLALGLLLLSRF